MKRSVVLALVALVLTSTVAACGRGTSSTDATASAPAAFTDRNADGAAIANAWFELLAQTGSSGDSLKVTDQQVKAGAELVRPYLDPAFQLQRASGERYTRENYVPIDIESFEISDVVVTEPRDDVKVLRYAVSTPGATKPDANMVMSGELAPRLTVVRWDEALGHWVIVSHANFNTPVAAICDQQPITVSSEAVPTNAEDTALGEQLVQRWRDVTIGKVKLSMRHPQAQIQLGDGQGWPNADGSAIKWSPAKAYDYADLAVTRNEDLLVTSYDAVVNDIVMEGEQFRSSSSPRLLTFMHTPDNTWELIGIANFTVPKGVPSDVDCVSTPS